MTIDLLIEALLLGTAYQSWALATDGVDNYYSRELTTEEANYVRIDLAQVLPYAATVAGLDVDLIETAENLVYLQVQIP